MAICGCIKPYNLSNRSLGKEIPNLMRVPQDDYNLESFCQELIDTDPAKLFEGFHFKHAKTYFYLTSPRTG
jgi:hypothetical protein